MPKGTKWPRISIVTPAYNQGEFIEETIRSVLLQGYPNLEYIVIDGGSTDGSLEIIRKYEPWLATWVSEPDHGQSHAINKGFHLATGDIFAWINSDDYYLPSAFATVARWLPASDWVLGTTHIVEIDGSLIKVIPPQNQPDPYHDRCFKIQTSKDFPTAQPGHFWSKRIWGEVGLLNETYHYCMDFDWMLRALALGYRPKRLHDPLACLRMQLNAKTNVSPWEFYLDNSKIFFNLGRRGVLRRKPALKISRRFGEIGYRAKSDALYLKNQRASSLVSALTAWALSKNLIGGSYWSRVKRSFSLYNPTLK